MEQELHRIKNAAMPLILEAKTLTDLEEIRMQFFGKTGQLTLIMKELAKLPKEERPEAGKQINEVKVTLENAFETAKNQLSLVKKHHYTIDVTEPGIKPPLGHLHLVTQAIEEITAIFEHIGFTRVRYPEIEWDWYAFEALNFPENHPARDDWETFFIDLPHDKKLGPVVLTPHTSSGQIREMERAVKMQQVYSSNEVRSSRNARTVNPINIKMLNIAKCYRRQSDVRHTPMFHQFETLVVGENISIAHLKGTLDYFAKSFFGPDRKTRIRPYHFQFTEPSFETDISCGFCDGKGCKLCKDGWLELGGAGMVHPNVLEYCGIDSKRYTGFASGWGVERVLMMKEGMEIDDLRLLYANKLEFHEQF